jgi:Na+-driven multidrug efflux pump
VVLNFVLIPAWGTTGAAIASLITQIASAIVIPAMIPALRDNVRLMLEAACLKDVWQK